MEIEIWASFGPVVNTEIIHYDEKKLGLKQFPWIKSLCFWISIRENILNFRMNSGQLKTKLDSVVLEK